MAGLLILVPAVLTAAQFRERLANPAVATPVTHPPGLGVLMKRGAFARASGEGSEDLVDSLTELFIGRGVEVIERERLAVLLKEHDFSLTNYVDRDAVATMGKILGPSVIIFINMQRRTVEKKSLSEDW